MENLLVTVKKTLSDNLELPFSVYTSFKEQKLLNVPITKPILIAVLDGDKELGKDNEIVCHAGEFIFLADSLAIDMRNIPRDNEYFALLIEFDHKDFSGLQVNVANTKDYCIGETTATLERCLQQFVESSLWAPAEVLSLRKREIITLLCHMGYEEILSLLGNPKIKDQLHEMCVQQSAHDLTIDHICEQLAMSESTLRRKLKSEGTGVQDIKDQARLGLGLHLLQTTRDSIGLIADQCGYQSQSRFTDRFKGRFGLTPSELRKTKMKD